jgi:FkbM family methyltransferase
MLLLPPRVADKPQYVFHPGRALRRLTRRFTRPDHEARVVELPWGLPLEVDTGDAIGYSIVVGGVFDPCVTETMHRLIDPGDAVIDAGANLGYMTSLAAARTGPDGRVEAFEPHPIVFELLERNVALWRTAGRVGEITLRRLALSDHTGKGALIPPPEFERQMGLAALAPDPSAAPNEAIPVTLARLDEVVSHARVGLLKIDVEGHEAGVLDGARDLLASGAVRDIVFEDHHAYPSEATAIVEGAGYRLISLGNDLFGLKLVAPAERGEVAAWPGPSYLATRDPARAVERLGRRGWEVQGIGPKRGLALRTAATR